MNQRLFSREQAAEYLGISPTGFDRHCVEKLTRHQIGKRVLWDRLEIDAKIIEKQEEEPQNEQDALIKAALAQL